MASLRTHQPVRLPLSGSLLKGLRGVREGLPAKKELESRSGGSFGSRARLDSRSSSPQDAARSCTLRYEPIDVSSASLAFASTPVRTIGMALRKCRALEPTSVTGFHQLNVDREGPAEEAAYLDRGCR